MLRPTRVGSVTTNSQELTSAPPSAEVAILTILPEAYDAVRRIFGLVGHTSRKGYQWAWGWLRVRDGNRVVVVTGLPLDRENIAAATFLDSMLEAWRPRNVLLVDIGGGVKGRDNVRLGDVVIHTFLHYYDYHKVREDGRESPRYLPLPGASTRLRELSRRPAQRGDDSWIASIPFRRPGGGVPKVLPGEMLVGGAIQSNSPRLLRLLQEHSKAIVVEMEGAGAGRAVLDWSTKGTPPEFLIVRGVSDYCNVNQERNQRTRDRWRRYAAATAAAHAHALVREMDSQSLGGAEQRLQQQRFSTPTGPVDNLWEVSTTVLRGRDRELEEVRQCLSEPNLRDEPRLPHVIWGEAGMGKSALARQIAEEMSSYYTARWWIDASDERKIRFGLRELARRLGIPSARMESISAIDEAGESRRFLADLREYLDSGLLGGRALVVLDNVDDPLVKQQLTTAALRYLPPTTCDVLITSQSSRWQPLAPTDTPLRGLDPAYGRELIAYESDRPSLLRNDAVEEIARVFGGRPLFLKQVAALLRDGDDPVDFRRRLRESEEDALAVLPEDFEPLWRRTYKLSIARADQALPGSQRLLEAIAFLSGEPVPLLLLHEMKETALGWRVGHVDAALATLTERSLLQCQRGGTVRSYLLHRIVGALVRTVVRERGRLPAAISLASSATARAIPSRDLIRGVTGQQTMATLAPHIEAIVDHVLNNRSQGLGFEILEKAAEASSMLGLYHRTSSEWEAAEDASRKAVELSQPLHSPCSTAMRKVRLANIMRQRASFEPAQGLLNEALPQLKEHGDDRDYAWALSVQARVLRHRPDSAPLEALPLLYEARELLMAFEGDPGTLRQRSELCGYISVVCRQLSKLDDAEDASAEGLRIITGGMPSDQVLETPNLPEEALVATHLRALGGVWRLRGDLRRAMEAHQRALDVFERVYGPDHTDVCRALDSLGRVQREWGDLDGAIDSFNRAERLSHLQFGPNHAHAGTAAVNLALVHLELKDPVKALAAAERGLRIYCLTYHEEEAGNLTSPPRNEATAWALFVCANCRAELGNLREAQRTHVTVLEWRRAHYPAVHALTASSYFALGDVHWRMGGKRSRDLSLSYHRRALMMREQVFGKGTNYWVAQSQARLGFLTDDQNLLRRAHETFSKQLRPGHWRTCEVAAAIRSLKGGV